MRDVLAAIDADRARHVDELKDLLRIPSVSSDPAHAADVRQAVEAVRVAFERIGITARVCETGGHPLCHAEWMGAPGKPTLLVYGHVDVQPVEPLAEWTTPPFEPVEVNGNLIARGASDPIR